jgi:hypothetical protein
MLEQSMCLWLSGAINRSGTLGPVCFLHMPLKVTDAQLLIHGQN